MNSIPCLLNFYYVESNDMTPCSRSFLSKSKIAEEYNTKSFVPVAYALSLVPPRVSNNSLTCSHPTSSNSNDGITPASPVHIHYISLHRNASRSAHHLHHDVAHIKTPIITIDDGN